VLIPATKSLTVSNKIPNGNINNDTIIVGSDGNFVYHSYLFFDISAIPKDTPILSAELVLFKTNSFYNSREVFYISPLSDHFSTYTTFNNRPFVNTVIKGGCFYPITTKVAVTANLTYFVSYWLKNKQATPSVMLYGRENNLIASFGSAISSDPYLIPFINVSFSPPPPPKKYKLINRQNECNCCDSCSRRCNCCDSCSRGCRCCVINNYMCPPQPPQPPQPPPSFEVVNVTGTVAAESTLAAVVNVGVTRSASGHTDNYYVSDIYDNSASLSPSLINATYTVAIVPPVNPGDTVNGAVYSSYKE
jgi:hypothetical protein